MIKLEIDGKVINVSAETEAELRRQLCPEAIELGCVKFRKWREQFGLVIGENQAVLFVAEDNVWKVYSCDDDRYTTIKPERCTFADIKIGEWFYDYQQDNPVFNCRSYFCLKTGERKYLYTDENTIFHSREFKATQLVWRLNIQ